jgi:hypothetical protein
MYLTVDVHERKKVVADQEFDQKIRTWPNGPPTPDFQNRVLAVKQKHRLTYWEVAERGWILRELSRQHNPL